MRVTSHIKLHSLVELAEPVDRFPAGRRGGVVDENSNGTVVVELTDDPSLDGLERLVSVAPDKLTLLRS